MQGKETLLTAMVMSATALAGDPSSRGSIGTEEEGDAEVVMKLVVECGPEVGLAQLLWTTGSSSMLSRLRMCRT